MQKTQLGAKNVPSTVLEESEGCFGELGTLPKEYHIVLDPTVPPVIDTSRNVAHKLRQELKQELIV